MKVWKEAAPTAVLLLNEQPPLIRTPQKRLIGGPVPFEPLGIFGFLKQGDGQSQERRQSQVHRGEEGSSLKNTVGK